MNVKKLGNILFWIVLLGLLFFVANNFYHRYKAKAEIENKLNRQQPTQQQGMQNQEAGKPLAPDFTLVDLEGKTIKLSDYRGKIVILNFWATWCPPCREEIPDLIKVSEELSKGEDAVVLAVNLTNGYNGENPDRVKKFVKDNKMTMKILLDEKEEAASQYGIASIPTTFFINRDGTVYGYEIKSMGYQDFMGVVNKMQ